MFDHVVARKLFALAGGGMLGQLLMFSVLPLLPQFYSPAEFGQLATFTSVVMLILPGVCLRLDIAIPLPDNDSESLVLVTLAVLSAFFIAILYGGVSVGIAELIGGEAETVIKEFGFLIPTTLFAAAIFSITQFWGIKKNFYKDLAVAHVSRGALGASVQLGLGLLNFGGVGLALGQAIYMGLGSVVLVYRCFRNEFKNLLDIDKRTLINTFKRYWRFPVISLPEALVNSVGANAPILFVIYMAGPEVGGSLYLAQRILTIPIGIVGSSLSRIYLGEAPQHFASGNLFRFTIRIMRALCIAGAVIFSAIYFFAQYAVGYLSDTEWEAAPKILTLLLPAAYFQFIATPVSTILYVTSRQLVSLVLQVFGLVLQLTFVAFFYSSELGRGVLGLSVGSAVFYLVYVFTVYHAAANSKKQGT